MGINQYVQVGNNVTIDLINNFFDSYLASTKNVLDISINYKSNNLFDCIAYGNTELFGQGGDNVIEYAKLDGPFSNTDSISFIQDYINDTTNNIISVQMIPHSTNLKYVLICYNKKNN